MKAVIAKFSLKTEKNRQIVTLKNAVATPKASIVFQKMNLMTKKNRLRKNHREFAISEEVYSSAIMALHNVKGGHHSDAKLIQIKVEKI